ncbi:fas-binding factor 1, partial [Asbolus verrucosus]
MNFGNDPMGDLLSDGSNDSFFDEPKPAAKRGSLTKTPEKKTITNLFNISDQSQERTQVPKKSDDWLGLDTKDTLLNIKKSPLKTPKLAKKISFENDDDILGTLGISKRPQDKPETRLEENKPTKKMDLLENILGPSKTEDAMKKTTFDDILKESKAKSATTTPTPVKLYPVADSVPLDEAPRERRRGRRRSTGLMDPLGLFSNEPNIPSKQEEADTTKSKTVLSGSDESAYSKPIHSKSTPNISDQGLPDWLGGSTIKQSKSENALNKKSEQPKHEVEAETPIKEVPKPTEKTTIPLETQESQAETLNSILTQQKLAHSHMEYHNTAIALQQQESQLLMALQLKKYEENVSEMQQMQQEVLMKQEQQFNMLLERQFAKQQIMENNMRLQQERINNHIQMLIAQPPINKHLTQEERSELKKTESEENMKIYENIISSLKQRQHEEIFLLEESYKKQIILLEQSLESVEKRLKTDFEKVSEVFEEKIKALHTQHEEEINKYKQKIQEIETQHAEELKQIRENNTRIIDEIKYEYSTLLENIKEAKKSESILFNESSSYIQKLDSNIEILYSNSKNIQELRTQMERDYGVLSKAREESLKVKEEEIVCKYIILSYINTVSIFFLFVVMRATLEKCRESAEKERAELLGLVRSLETKVAEQNQNSREERWAFQQAASTLAARSAALDREAEFNRASIEREREQLKAKFFQTLKESVLAEQENMILQLTEEKLAASAEKARLETSSKLMNYDTQRAKTEIDAAIKIAKEATEMADKEREHLHREKCEVERLKRFLLDQERKLSLREVEVENSMRVAEQKISEGEKAISESKTIENKYNERLKDLQNQLVLLSNREKKLAEEKISLSKERFALNTMMRQNKRCSLCAADSQTLNENNLNVNVITPYFSRYDNIDSDIIRLRLEAIDDEHNSSPNIQEHVP